MGEWVEKRLGEVATVIMGQSPKSEYYNTDGIGLPFLQGNRTFGAKYPTFDTFTTEFSKIAKVKDVIMSVRAPVGDLNITQKEICLGRGVCAIRAKNNNNEFLFYLLSQSIPIILSRSNGTVYDSINRTDIENMKVFIPKKEKEQTRIAEILSAYDDAIENNNRRIALLEKAAQELYREWFVRFRFPGYKKAKFVNGLPEGWEVVSFGKIVEIIDGDRGVNYPKQNEFSPDGYCLFLNAGNVTKNGFNFNDNAFITENKDKLLRKGKLTRNDIVLTTRGTVGNVAFYNKHIKYDVVRINSGMVILRDYGEVPATYLYSVLVNEMTQTMITLFSSGSAQPQLPIKDMKKMKMLKPTNDVLLKFSNIANDIYDKIALLQTQSQNLARQRDLLLLRLMSGKLEV